MNFALKSSFHVFALKLPTVMSLCYEEREHDFFLTLDIVFQNSTQGQKNSLTSCDNHHERTTKFEKARLKVSTFSLPCPRWDSPREHDRQFERRTFLAKRKCE